MANHHAFRAGFVLLATTVACGGDETPNDGGSSAAETRFDGESELFPSLDFTTGLLPPESPVMASFSVSAKGLGTVHAAATASGSEDDATLTGLPGKGQLA